MKVEEVYKFVVISATVFCVVGFLYVLISTEYENNVRYIATSELNKKATAVLENPNLYVQKSESDPETNSDWHVNVEGDSGIYTEEENARQVVLKRNTSVGEVVVKKQDLNKSRIIGKYVGKKSKEAFKGFVEGVFKGEK